MSKMGQLAMEIETALFDGATADEISALFDIPIQQVYEFIEQLEASYNEELDGQPDTYTEYQDLYGGDDAFETCNYFEDF